MPKEYAADPIKCPAEGRTVHRLIYMGTAIMEGRKVRSREYRCDECGDFVQKAKLQEATSA